MRKILTAITLSTLLAAPALAQSVTYNIDPTHTFPQFSYSHIGLSKQTLRFNKTSGTVTLDEKAKEASVDIEIDMTSIDTGFALFDEHIQSDEFFNTEKFPKATFKSTQVIYVDNQPTKIEGDLTIKDVTKPVTLEVTHFASMLHPMLEKPAIGANAKTTILRSDFDVGHLVPAVSDEVTINISLEAIAE